MARQATEAELEGLPNGWRELEIGEILRKNMKARCRGFYEGRRYDWEDISGYAVIQERYDPSYHRILCVEAE